jgi:anaerobic magnesium-protoporphyrin IX monomethyl ester cyclase
MKVVLINTPYMEIYGPIKTAVGAYFPLGLGYIAAVLREAGHKVKLLDPEPVRMSLKALGDALEREDPDLVGIGCATPNFLIAQKIARMAKERTHAKVSIGGVHVSAMPEDTLRDFPEFDFVVVGEGEYTVLDIANGKDPSSIEGLVHRSGGRVVRNPDRPWITDVDSLPFPARDLVDLRLYNPSVYVDIGKKSATMITSRGCPSRCTFCASHLTLGRGFRPHSPEYVIREMEHLVRDYGVKHLVIQDDTFTLDKERAKRICRLMIEKKLNVSWYCFSRVNGISRDLVGIMKKAGCYSIGYGVESASEEVLQNIKKGITPDEVRRAFKITRDFNIRILAFFMFGNPGDTRKTIEETIRFAKELKPELAFFNLLVPYPGTEIYDNLDKYGFKLCGDLRSFVAIGPHAVVSRIGFSHEDLQRYVSRANKEFYLRPLQLFRILKTIRTPAQFFIYLRGGMGLFMQMMAWEKSGDGGSE